MGKEDTVVYFQSLSETAVTKQTKLKGDLNMTRIFFNENGVIIPSAISKEEDLKLTGRIIINAPPEDGRCDVCGRHISELKPFGGPGDPLVGDFTGEFLVKRGRPAGPYDEEAEKAWDEAEKATHDDPLPWFIAKFGKEKGEDLYWAGQLYGCVGKSWECRDCIVLDLDEYFEKIKKR
jgi:hypothetical protein